MCSPYNIREDVIIMEMNESVTERSGERTLEQIEADIERTKAEIAQVHGTETEVYARIVGYYRAVRNWNKGKRDEYAQRKLFSIEESRNEQAAVCDEAERNERASATIAGEGGTKAYSTTVAATSANGKAASYVLYFRQVCPNCPPVKQYLSHSALSGVQIDVDTDAGLEQAAAQGVFSTPTAIIRDSYGIEIGRAHSVEELDALLNTQPKEAVIA